MKKIYLLKIASATVLAIAGISAQAAGPDWSLIITGPGIVVPPAPVQVAPARVAPIVVAPPAAAPAQAAAVQGFRPDPGWERDRDRQYQDRFQERFQERENFFMERERAFIAREKAFLEREKQRQLVVENNTKASNAINARRDQQLDAIVQGVSVGGIDKNEFINLMAQQKIIRDREASFLSDGFFSQDEYQALSTDLNNAEQAIRFAARSDRPRRDRDGDRERIYYPQNR